jgi:hypothetical protein
VESLVAELKKDNSHPADRYDAVEAERLYSASYTTEVERIVTRAALHGTPMPVLQESFAGNDVEMF